MSIGTRDVLVTCTKTGNLHIPTMDLHHIHNTSLRQAVKLPKPCLCLKFSIPERPHRIYLSTIPALGHKAIP